MISGSRYLVRRFGELDRDLFDSVQSMMQLIPIIKVIQLVIVGVNLSACYSGSLLAHKF